MADRRFLIALALSLAFHLGLLIGPAWRLVLGPDEPPGGMLLEARLMAPKPVAEKRPPAKPRPAAPAQKVPPAPTPAAQLAMPGESPAVVADGATGEKQGEVKEAAPDGKTDKAAEPPAPAAALAPFSDMLASANQGTVSYQVMLGRQGLIVGRMVHRWKREQGRYELESVTETVGLASLFRRIKLVQQSRGSVSEAALVPEEFITIQDEGGGDVSRTATRFDWQAMRLSMEKDGNRQETRLDAGAQDLLSFIYQLVLHPPLGRSDLRISTGKAYNSYSLEYRGEETVPSPVGDVKARHYATVGPPGEQNTELWLSQELGYLPVRVRFVDRKGGVVDAQVQSVDFGGVSRRQIDQSPLDRSSVR